MDANYRFGTGSRLPDAAAFSRVFGNAGRSRDQHFTVLYRSRTGGAGKAGRLGLAISKKHCKLATGRNRIKRLVRESFRQHQDLLAGLDIVVMNQPPAAKADNEKLRSCLLKHWNRCQAEAGKE